MAENREHRLRAAFQNSERLIQGIKSEFNGEFEHPLVSIIMPTFNRGHIISHAIGSVLEQTYDNWELWICDDGSDDDTENIITAYKDKRIKYLKLQKVGAAEARNLGSINTHGDYICYLDTDNIWHPDFLTTMACIFRRNGGIYCAYSKYVDITIKKGKHILKKFISLPFDYEALLKKNFIDLSTFFHRRELYECLGGFNPHLLRRQDYDLLLKYAFLRPPYYIDAFLMIYRRNKAWQQITETMRNDNSCDKIINDTVSSYFQTGLPILKKSSYKSVTVLSWDICRNHFSKAFNIAECLSKDFDVQLIGFRFFEEEIFRPYEDEVPSFDTLYLKGDSFPDFSSMLEKALESIRGDIIYAVKPRLPSFGLALLANNLLGKPLILEINDLESIVSNPTHASMEGELRLEEVDLSDRSLRNPYSDIWSRIMESLAKQAPIKVTHNRNLNAHFGGNCFFVRNLKDEHIFDPDMYDRTSIREQLGFTAEDRIILFGGMLRVHKGIYELINLLESISDPRYKLLFVASRVTPDQRTLISKFKTKVRFLPPQNRNEMAKINLAADVVLVWLDPEIGASHYQMPYKLTDAFAMKVPVIANNISDMGELARAGCLRLVDYGDFEQANEGLNAIFENPDQTKQMVENARRLFLREFSYASARANFHLISNLTAKIETRPLAISREFAKFFSRVN